MTSSCYVVVLFTVFTKVTSADEAEVDFGFLCCLLCKQDQAMLFWLTIQETSKLLEKGERWAVKWSSRADDFEDKNEVVVRS